MRNPASHEAPPLLICCGVSGSGKTTLAKALAQAYALEFVEADDFHPQANRERMAAGQPLDEQMRSPWVQAICTHLTALRARGGGVVMSNSCLRRAHRDRYRALGFETCFLYLHGDYAAIRERMEKRRDHYMPASLLTSQFLDLEDPSTEADVLALDGQQSPAAVLQQARRATDTLISNWRIRDTQ